MSLLVKNSKVEVCDAMGKDLIVGRIMFALGVATVAFQRYGQDCVITSGVDGQHNSGSLHPLGKAVDLRSRLLEQETLSSILREIGSVLGPMGFDIVAEREHDTGATTGAHIHIEYDPRSRPFWKMLSA
jgi:hypothetical protein